MVLDALSSPRALVPPTSRGALRLASRSLVPGSAAEVFDLLADPETWPRWWPATHTAARTLARGAADGTGRRVELRSRLGAGLALDWRWRLLSAVRPHECVFALEGDVAGTAAWSLTADGPYAVVDAAWELRVRGALRHAFGRLLAPVLAAAHRRAVRAGELALRIELRRRHAVTAHERAMIPPPPGGSWRTHGAQALAEAALAPISGPEPPPPAA
jgi:hypothetical protein